MYGDHLPSLNLEEDDLDGITLYQTEWIMWDNMNLPVEHKNFTAYQASTYIFNQLGIKGGLMQNFHTRYMNSNDQQGYLDKLELLEYDTLYGNDYAFDGHNPFPTTDMKMGIRDISVDHCEIKGDKLWIYGDGFNLYSLVYIDGKSVDTTWQGSRILTVPLEEVKDGEELYVAQAGDDHVVLSVTNTVSIKDVETVDTMQETSEEATTEITTESTTEK